MDAEVWQRGRWVVAQTATAVQHADNWFEVTLVGQSPYLPLRFFEMVRIRVDGRPAVQIIGQRRVSGGAIVLQVRVR